MEQKDFNERASRLEEVGKVIAKLPTEIRQEAFGLLKGYVTKQAAPAGDADEAADAGSDAPEGDDTDSSLFAKFSHDKPAENVRLIVAYLFQQYGVEPFTIAEIEAIANDTGITVPARIDMTLRQATEDGKPLFVSTEKGKWKVSVRGELYLKATYKVKKGTKTRAKVSA